MHSSWQNEESRIDQNGKRRNGLELEGIARLTVGGTDNNKAPQVVPETRGEETSGAERGRTTLKYCQHVTH